jgi:hypothetical protein
LYEPYISAAIVAAASSWVANALMLFSMSMVKIILNLLCFRSLCGHDMDRSEVLETQGNSEINRRGRKTGDDRRAVVQIAPGCAK